MLFSQRAGIGGFKGPEMLQPFVISKMEDTTGFNQYLPFPCNHQSDQRGSTANGSSLPKISLPILVFAFIFFFCLFSTQKGSLPSWNCPESNFRIGHCLLFHFLWFLFLHS